MAEGRAIIEGITDLDTANAALPKMQAIQHALTSKKEIAAILLAKTKQCNLFYDRVLKQYTPAPPEKKDKKGAA